MKGVLFGMNCSGRKISSDDNQLRVFDRFIEIVRAPKMLLIAQELGTFHSNLLYKTSTLEGDGFIPKK